jgi:hypothetical protein
VADLRRLVVVAKYFVAVVAFAAVTFVGASRADAAEKDELRVTQVGSLIVPMAPQVEAGPKPERPAVLPALYASLGAMQIWDVYSTRAALKAGAREANVAAAPFAQSTGSMLGLKAAATASTIFFAERLWKKHKATAIVMMVAINGATAAVAMRNTRNARIAGQ